MTKQLLNPGSNPARILPTIFHILGAVLVILVLLYLALGISFFGGKGWSWTLGIVASIVSIIVGIARVAFQGVSTT